MRWRRRRRKSVRIVRTILPRNSLCRKGKVVQLLVICPPRAFIQIHPECVWVVVCKYDESWLGSRRLPPFATAALCWPVASFYLHP